MNFKETVVVEFDKKEADILNNANTVLSRLYDEMNNRGKDFIGDSDDFGYTCADISRAEDIISFLLSDGQFTLV